MYKTLLDNLYSIKLTPKKNDKKNGKKTAKIANGFVEL